MKECECASAIENSRSEARRVLSIVMATTQDFKKRIYEAKVKAYFVLKLGIKTQNQIEVTNLN